MHQIKSWFKFTSLIQTFNFSWFIRICWNYVDNIAGFSVIMTVSLD